MNRRTAGIVGFLTLFCGLVHLIGSGALDRLDVPFDDRRFDAASWKQWDGRMTMAGDLLGRHMRPGMMRKDVQTLLGEDLTLHSLAEGFRLDSQSQMNLKVVYSDSSSFHGEDFGSRAVCYLGKNEWRHDYYYLYLYFDRTGRYRGGVVQVDDR